MRRTATMIVLAVLLAPVVAHVVFVLLPGAASYVVRSGSMAPAIPAGSIAYVHETGAYAPGDVISYRRGDTVITHRIVDESAQGYLTKGDANDAVDGRSVAAESIVGEVVAVVPLYGYLIATASTPIGYAGLVLAPGLALIAVELRRAAGRAP